MRSLRPGMQRAVAESMAGCMTQRWSPVEPATSRTRDWRSDHMHRAFPSGNWEDRAHCCWDTTLADAPVGTRWEGLTYQILVSLDAVVSRLYGPCTDSSNTCCRPAGPVACH